MNNQTFSLFNLWMMYMYQDHVLMALCVNLSCGRSGSGHTKDDHQNGINCLLAWQACIWVVQQCSLTVKG